MTTVTTEQGATNTEYVRRLIRQKQPGFSAALESAAGLVERELTSPEMPRPIGATDRPLTSNPAPRQAHAADLAAAFTETTVP